MKKRLIAMLLLAFILLVQTNVTAYAITTEFMVPDVAANRNFDNVLYASPNNNVMVSKFSYGLVGDVMNTSGLDGLLSELSANSDPSQYGNSILGIYMEGAALSDANVSLIASEGWKKVELYYEKYMISGSVPARGMKPVLECVEDAAVSQTLTNAGFTGQVGVFKVSDVAMTEPLAILYAPEFDFLRGGNVLIYKYIPDIQRFVAGPTGMYDGYDRSFMDMEGLHLADGDPNGTFVVLRDSLPVDLVITSEEIQPLRDQLKQEAESETQTVEDSNDAKTTITSENESVAWTFANGEAPENFTAEAKVEASSEKEIKVDFDYSGKLPEGTQVTIQIPEGAIKCEDGATLYFYYCNPKTEEKEFVSEGIFQEGKVSFDIEHCSEYLITTEKLVEVDIVEKEPNVLPVIAIGVVALGAVGFAVYSIKKKGK